MANTSSSCIKAGCLIFIFIYVLVNMMQLLVNKLLSTRLQMQYLRFTGRVHLQTNPTLSSQDNHCIAVSCCSSLYIVLITNAPQVNPV